MYFHNGDYQSKTEFYRNECVYEEVYIAQLQQGSYIKSIHPYFFSASNGHLSLATHKYAFGYYDSNHHLLDFYELSFISECNKEPTDAISQTSHFSSSLYIGGIFIIICILLTTVIIKRRKHD